MVAASMINPSKSEAPKRSQKVEYLMSASGKIESSSGLSFVHSYMCYSTKLGIIQARHLYISLLRIRGLNHRLYTEMNATVSVFGNCEPV